MLKADIILIEDNSSDADLIKRALKKSNLVNNLVHLQDGQEAIDYIFGNGKIKILPRPRLILLDLKMPKLSGLEVLKRQKSNNHTKAIPVVILTSSKEEPDLQKCYELSANSYVVKPVVFDDFIKAIAQVGLYWLLVNEPIKN